ncbi:putative lipoyltransferase 2, mitochondrial [Coccinella septempunctata]|uniref:putative lipoyltransferase 2, mitochondrial n=1 Tax=Coccinella septempunctata TaxID=41139 RepID=UPI001D0893A0|nr:putative lipoyltransferase 2, mitochondrial [Coccinella septempunctata]
MSPLVKILKLGTLSYETGLKLQCFMARKHILAENQNTLLLLEHKPVYTVGLRSSTYDENVEKKLRTLGADFHRTNRGGLITFHGPGQLIAYPILNLKEFKLTMKCYIASLEKTIISLCDLLNLNAYTCEHTGVWINDKKVCAIGVHGSRYITTHGLALNCSLDVLKWFEHIVPCGIEGKGVTSLSKELQKSFSVNEAADLFLNVFSDTFRCEYIDLSKDENNSLLAEVLLLKNQT